MYSICTVVKDIKYVILYARLFRQMYKYKFCNFSDYPTSYLVQYFAGYYPD